MEIKVLATGSSGNAYLIKSGRGRLLIECGIPFDLIRKKLWYEKESITTMDACLISHSHMDHCRAIDKVRRYGLDCYMSEECADDLQINGERRVKVIPHSQGAYVDINLDYWRIRAFEAVHDVHCLGFVIDSYTNNERLLYISDSEYNPYVIPGLTHIMVSCNYSLDLLNEAIEKDVTPVGAKARIMHSHTSLETVKAMLEANHLDHVQEIRLLHISGRHGDRDLFKKEIQELTGKEVYV